LNNHHELIFSFFNLWVINCVVLVILRCFVFLCGGLSVRTFIFIQKMSDVREKNIDSFIISKDSSPSSGNSESAQRESDSSEGLMQKSDSKEDSSLGSLCASDEYPRLDVPIEHEKQCYVVNYKLKTPAGKFYRYNGPFPPDPKILEELDSQDIC
ncbi:hypothetical protein T09_478, partial [Trichinella sp. T9]